MGIKYNLSNFNKVNKSFSDNANKLIRIVNKLTKGLSAEGYIKTMQKAYLNKLINLYSTKPNAKFNSDTQDFLFDYYKDDNHKLAKALPNYSKHIELFNK